MSRKRFRAADRLHGVRAITSGVIAARTGDLMAATELGPVDELESRLWAYAISQGASRDDAADAVQDAFVRLAVARASDKSIENIDGWLYTTVHRLVVDQARSRSLLQRSLTRLSSLRESRMALDPPEASSDEVWNAVDTLPARQRAAIYLRYRADLHYATIADVLAVSESAAHT